MTLNLFRSVRLPERNQASRSGRIVFVGAGKAMEHKSMLGWMLREAMPYGLDIYGSGWQDLPEFSPFWRGVLPERDLVGTIARSDRRSQVDGQGAPQRSNLVLYGCLCQSLMRTFVLVPDDILACLRFGDSEPSG